MTHKRHCRVCGREFHTVRYKNRYCSSNCQKKAKEFKYEVPSELQEDGTPYLSALMYNKVCPTCGKEFTAKKKNTKFCSHQCSKLYRLHATDHGHNIALKGKAEAFFSKDTGKVIYRKQCLNCGLDSKHSRSTQNFAANPVPGNILRISKGLKNRSTRWINSSMPTHPSGWTIIRQRNIYVYLKPANCLGFPARPSEGMSMTGHCHR